MDKVCIEFENGKKINLELYKEHAPLSVENFLKLRRALLSPHYRRLYDSRRRI